MGRETIPTYNPLLGKRASETERGGGVKCRIISLEYISYVQPSQLIPFITFVPVMKE